MRRIRRSCAPLLAVALALLAATAACGGGDDATTSPPPRIRTATSTVAATATTSPTPTPTTAPAPSQTPEPTPPPTPEPTPTEATTPVPSPTPVARVLGSIVPRGGGARTVVAGTAIELALALFDSNGKAIDLADLQRTPLIGWYVPSDADGMAVQWQEQARVAVTFISDEVDERAAPQQYEARQAVARGTEPFAPLAGVVGHPAAVRFTAPVYRLGKVVVRAVVAAVDCTGGGSDPDPRAAARWDGPCSAEFTITVVPAPATPTPVPCESVDCIRENLCRGVECLEAEAAPRPCRGYDCVEAVPYAFERRVFGPGERIDWDDGVFLFQVETGRTEAYRVGGAVDYVGYTPSATWVQVDGRGDPWDLLLHRESGRAWRWAAGTTDLLNAFLREELGLESPFSLTSADVLPLPESECPGLPSPDGRYVAQQWGHPGIGKWHRTPPPSLYSIPSVVIVDAEACEPLFRVRSAYTYQGFWEGTWLPGFEGFVLGVEGGYAIARVSDPTLVPLPAGPPGHAVTHEFGPVPAPTGNDRYFLYGSAGVYDRWEDDWALTGFSRTMVWYSWGETHEEAWYQPGLFEGGGVSWMLSRPTIEYPPFEEVAFRVRQPDGCLDLREQPTVGQRLSTAFPMGRGSPYRYRLSPRRPIAPSAVATTPAFLRPGTGAVSTGSTSAANMA